MECYHTMVLYTHKNLVEIYEWYYFRAYKNELKIETFLAKKFQRNHQTK